MGRQGLQVNFRQHFIVSSEVCWCVLPFTCDSSRRCDVFQDILWYRYDKGEQQTKAFSQVGWSAVGEETFHIEDNVSLETKHFFTIGTRDTTGTGGQNKRVNIQFNGCLWEWVYVWVRHESGDRQCLVLDVWNSFVLFVLFAGVVALSVILKVVFRWVKIFVGGGFLSVSNGQRWQISHSIYSQIPFWLIHPGH